MLKEEEGLESGIWLEVDGVLCLEVCVTEIGLGQRLREEEWRGMGMQEGVCVCVCVCVGGGCCLTQKILK